MWRLVWWLFRWRLGFWFSCLLVKELGCKNWIVGIVRIGNCWIGWKTYFFTCNMLFVVFVQIRIIFNLELFCPILVFIRFYSTFRSSQELICEHGLFWILMKKNEIFIWSEKMDKKIYSKNIKKVRLHKFAKFTRGEIFQKIPLFDVKRAAARKNICLIDSRILKS